MRKLLKSVPVVVTLFFQDWEKRKHYYRNVFLEHLVAESLHFKMSKKSTGIDSSICSNLVYSKTLRWISCFRIAAKYNFRETVNF